MSEVNTETSISPEEMQKQKEQRLHDFRSEISKNIQKAVNMLPEYEGKDGEKQINLALIKLEEGKMWVGKVLEAIGSPFPKELRDDAKKDE